jgi:hypothetical protein
MTNLPQSEARNVYALPAAGALGTTAPLTVPLVVIGPPETPQDVATEVTVPVPPPPPPPPLPPLPCPRGTGGQFWASADVANSAAAKRAAIIRFMNSASVVGVIEYV